MNLRKASLLLTGLACSVAGTNAFAQVGQTSGAIRGLVTSKDGNFVENATVMLKNLETGASRTVRTDMLGYFAFPLLPVGPYEITVTAQGMRTAKDNRVRVSLGQTSTVNFDLDKATAEATVEVVAASELLDTRQINSITAIDEQLVKTVPLATRNFTDLALLTPGLSGARDGRVTSEGSRGIANNLSIDGASFNSKFFGEQRGSTRIPFAFGADTIRELQIITNAFDAQYGNFAGALINAVTKGGTNEFTGTALYQIRPESMVAKIRPVPYDPNGTTNTEKARTKSFHQYSANLNVGGPIVRDRLHFFIGVETFNYTEDYTTILPTTATPGNGTADLNNFLGALGNTLVVAPGRTFAQDFNRTYTNDRKNTVFFGRLDWTVSENHRATLRVNSQNWRSVNGTTTGTGAASVGESNNGIEENRSLSWVAELNSVFGSNLVNEARFQVASERRPRLAQSTISSEIAVAGRTAGQNEFLPNGLDETTTQIIDNLTYTTGDWTLKGGIDLQGFDYLNQFFRRQNGQWSFSTYNAAYQWSRGTAGNLVFGNSNPGNITFQQGISDVNGYIGFQSRYDAAYLQGQYSGLLKKRLLLSLGARFTRESYDDNPRPNPKFMGLDRAANNSSIDPRFGFTYDLNGNQKTVIKGGFGVFSSNDSDLIVSNTMFANGFGVRNYSITLNSSNLSHFKDATGILSAARRIQGGSLTRLSRAEIDPDNPDSLFTKGALTGQLWDPENKMPQAKRFTFGVDWDASALAKGMKISTRFDMAKFNHLQYFINVNIWQLNADGTVNPNGYYNDGFPTKVNRFISSGSSIPGLPSGRPNFAIIRGRRVDLTGFGNVNLTKNDGEGTYRALIVEVDRRSEGGLGFHLGLTFSKAEDNNSNERTTAGADSNTSNPADPLALTARTDNDREFRGVGAVYFPIYWGIKGSTVFSYATGRPYSAFDTRDLNGDGLFGNDLAKYTYGRNGYRQPHEKRFDIRFTRDFKFSQRFGLEAGIDVFNLFNWANQTTTRTSAASGSGSIRDFGYINTPDRDTREVQFTLRARF